MATCGQLVILAQLHVYTTITTDSRESCAAQFIKVTTNISVFGTFCGLRNEWNRTNDVYETNEGKGASIRQWTVPIERLNRNRRKGTTRLSGGDEGTERVTDRLGCDVFTAAAVLEKRTLRLVETQRWNFIDEAQKTTGLST